MIGARSPPEVFDHQKRSRCYPQTRQHLIRTRHPSLSRSATSRGLRQRSRSRSEERFDEIGFCSREPVTCQTRASRPQPSRRRASIIEAVELSGAAPAVAAAEKPARHRFAQVRPFPGLPSQILDPPHRKSTAYPYSPLRASSLNERQEGTPLGVDPATASHDNIPPLANPHRPGQSGPCKRRG